MDLAKQRAIELIHQKAALHREFDDWRARSQRGEPLEKHNTQIARLTAQLEGFLAAIGDPDLGAPSFAENERIYTRLLGAQRIWAYFRTKLALRDVDWLSNSLKAADELAWACYKPAREKAKAAKTIDPDALKEPPLVFFTTEATPYAQGRDSPFAPEGITSRDVLDFGLAVLKLPIPLVGVPWFQVNHLPSAVVIAHEVGHAVDRDFGLRRELEKKIQALAIADDRKTAWIKWLPELLADCYGILGTGPAYVYALTGYLADAPEVVERETRSAQDWQTYPTRHLRVLFNLQVLDALDLGTEELAAAWNDAYAFHQLPAFEADLAPVAEAILATPLPVFGDARLIDVLWFDPAVDQKSALRQANNILQGFGLDQGTPVNRLVAATTLAYVRNPELYRDKNGDADVLAAIVAAIPAGVRKGEVLLGQQEVRRSQADAAAGAALLDLFAAAGE